MPSRFRSCRAGGRRPGCSTPSRAGEVTEPGARGGRLGRKHSVVRKRPLRTYFAQKFTDVPRLNGDTTSDSVLYLEERR
jgi:hypothetical protein